MAAEIDQNWYKLTAIEDKKVMIMQQVANFTTSQSQRTYDNILKGVNTVTGIFKKGTTVNDNATQKTFNTYNWNPDPNQ